MALDVRQVLPHRFPFLFVDALVSQDGDDFECVKNVTHNEPFFAGHFPQEPVMPGVLIVEALAQAAGVALAAREGGAPGGIGYLAGIESARFRRKVVPGDVLRLKGRIVLFRRGLCKVEATALVGEEVAAEATLSFVYAG
ncbi:MAG TPA: 3-hydroxyacyl-ACP dehydratase FabZ [Trueperaceae bacterium]